MNLQVAPQTEQKLKKIFDQVTDQETFAQNIISWQVADLKKSILNIRLDIKEFEDKYNITTQDFYLRFEQGMAEDSEDFIIWAGLYEMLAENERRLKDLE